MLSACWACVWLRFLIWLFGGCVPKFGFCCAVCSFVLSRFLSAALDCSNACWNAANKVLGLLVLVSDEMGSWSPSTYAFINRASYEAMTAWEHGANPGSSKIFALRSVRISLHSS